MTYKGKIRCHIYKYDDVEFKIEEQEVFEDRFIYNSTSQSLEDFIADLSFDDQIQEELKSYPGQCEVEIIADIHIENYKTWTDCGYEYDFNYWLANVRHQKIIRSKTEPEQHIQNNAHS